MDKVAFRILLIALTIFEVVLLIGAFFLQYENKNIPDFVTGAIPAVLTGMLGLAVHSNNTDEPQQVVNAPGEAINVAPVGPAHRADNTGVDTLN
jgi:hypothetical protein